MQVIQLSERLEEAEGGAESQVGYLSELLYCQKYSFIYVLHGMVSMKQHQYFVIFQFEINKKRDTELLKLRKLLEDVHLESEETAAILKRKHQEIVVDFQEQIDSLAKAKSR